MFVEGREQKQGKSVKEQRDSEKRKRKKEERRRPA